MVLESPEISPGNLKITKKKTAENPISLEVDFCDWMWRPPFLKVLSSGGSPT